MDTQEFCSQVDKLVTCNNQSTLISVALIIYQSFKNKFCNGKLKIIIKETKIIALAHLGQAEK